MKPREPPPLVTKLSAIRCEDCWAAGVVSVYPGTEPARVLDLFLEEHGVPVRGWCLACAMRHGWLEQAPPVGAAA